MRSPLRLAFLVAATTALASHAALAADDVDQAKALFNAGAQAYAATRYQDAVQSFQAAYKKAPRPAILFSLAQAYRRLYVVDRRPEALKEAMANYRRYLADVPQGGRRADAAEALSELEVIAARIEPSEPAVTAVAPPVEPGEIKLRTRINVTSPTAEARVSVDGGALTEVPLLQEVSPGKHRIKIVANGYVDEERELLAVEGEVTGFDRELRERPARIEIRAPAGAQVMLDGRLVGTAPLAPIEAAPGRRFLAVTMNGYQPFSRDLSLKRGQRRAVQVKFSMSLQRKLSYGLFVTGGLSTVAGVVTMIKALSEQEKAQKLWDQRESRGISEAELGQYDQHLSNRDQFRIFTTSLAGAAVTLTLGGFVFYTLDTPSPPPLPVRTEPTPSRKTAPTMDFAAAPLLAPGVAGAAIIGRF